MTNKKSLPAAVPMKRPGLVITAQEKSSSKTLTMSMVCDVALRSGCSPQIFQNDLQSRLAQYGTPQRILVSDTEAILENEMADFDAHGPLLGAFKGLSDNESAMVIYDTAAGSMARLPTILDQLDVNGQLVELDVSALVLVPVSARADVAEAALATYVAMARVLPDQIVMPVVFFRDGDPVDLPSDHAFWKLMARAKHGVITQPRIIRQIGLLLERTDKTLSDMADTTDDKAIEQLAVKLDTSEVRVRMLISVCRDIVVHIDEQFHPLGFQPGA